MPLHGVAPVIYSCHGTIGKREEIQHVVGSWPLEMSSGVCAPVHKCFILEGNKMFTCSHQSNPSESQVAEKSPWQPTAGDMPMKVAHKVSETITFITNSSDKLLWLPCDFISYHRWWV
jgi:hypothetical protein